MQRPTPLMGLQEEQLPPLNRQQPQQDPGFLQKHRGMLNYIGAALNNAANSIDVNSRNPWADAVSGAAGGVQNQMRFNQMQPQFENTGINPNYYNPALGGDMSKLDPLEWQKFKVNNQYKNALINSANALAEQRRKADYGNSQQRQIDEVLQDMVTFGVISPEEYQSISQREGYDPERMVKQEYLNQMLKQRPQRYQSTKDVNRNSNVNMNYGGMPTEKTVNMNYGGGSTKSKKNNDDDPYGLFD